MLLRWLLAAGHLLALGIGLGAIWARARALRAFARTADRSARDRALVADGWWGIAAVLWLVTGLWRLFAGTEKAPAYYYGNHVFWTKMALFISVAMLEVAPMLSLMRWRVTLARGAEPDVSRAALWARISHVQAVLVILLILAATAMARGLGGETSGR